jgi:3-isopropylmalate/(R)-2-methylmalate dehydratase small subunit
MQATKSVTGTMCPLDANDVDTDQIMPKQFLKRVERSGYGPFAFFEWRYLEDGVTPDPEFTMNKPEHQGASILLAGRNFGCGSSREHAPWGIEDAGFRVVIAPSFADIFRSNCGNIGVVAVELDEATVANLFEVVAAHPQTPFTVDLESMTVTGGGISASFTLDSHTRHRLLNGLDPIDLSLQHADDITAYESTRPAWRPSILA